MQSLITIAGHRQGQAMVSPGMKKGFYKNALGDLFVIADQSA
jgi:hypothetical protein